MGMIVNVACLLTGGIRLRFRWKAPVASQTGPRRKSRRPARTQRERRAVAHELDVLLGLDDDPLTPSELQGQQQLPLLASADERDLDEIEAEAEAVLDSSSAAGSDRERAPAA
jgi:hypothetical protein